MIKLESLSKTVANPSGFDSLANYIGSVPEVEWLKVITRNRDSDILTESNFQCALDQLGGESDTVEIFRFGHWACGWWEALAVKKGSKEEAIAQKIVNDLDAYPVLDENDFSEREMEYHAEYAEQAKDDLAEALSIHFGVKNSKALKDLAFNLNMECQAYYGSDSCVNIYSNCKPDARDIERLKECLKQVGYYDLKSSRVFKTLCKKVGL